MAIERSADFGKTWETLKLFAQNCSAEFGLPDDVGQRRSLCTSRYTSASPCTKGEVGTHGTTLEAVTVSDLRGALDALFSSSGDTASAGPEHFYNTGPL